MGCYCNDNGLWLLMLSSAQLSFFFFWVLIALYWMAVIAWSLLEIKLVCWAFIFWTLFFFSYSGILWAWSSLFFLLCFKFGSFFIQNHVFEVYSFSPFLLKLVSLFFSWWIFILLLNLILVDSWLSFNVSLYIEVWTVIHYWLILSGHLTSCPRLNFQFFCRKIFYCLNYSSEIWILELILFIFLV